MRFLHGTAINQMREASGQPLCELIVFHHEGHGTDGPRDLDELRVWLNAPALRQFIDALERYLAEMQAMAELVPAGEDGNA